MSDFHLHYVPYDDTSSLVAVEVQEKFIVLQAYSQDGRPVMPQAYGSDIAALVPAGIDGLPYFGGNLREAGSVSLSFPVQIVSILIATYGVHPPNARVTAL